jgi:hypothetical protein
MTNKPFLLYLAAFLSGSLLNILLLIMVCNGLHFDSKSSICVYLYGVTGYFVKAAIFFLFYLLFYDENNVYDKIKRRFILWTPALLFFLWFFSVIFFQMESFYTDLSFGYISHFPHFFIQFISVIITCTVVSIYTIRVIKNADKNEVLLDEEQM